MHIFFSFNSVNINKLKFVSKTQTFFNDTKNRTFAPIFLKPDKFHYLKREVNQYQKAAQYLCGLELCIVMSPKVHKSNSHTMYPLLPTQKFHTHLFQIKVQKMCWKNVLFKKVWSFLTVINKTSNI